MAAVTLQRPLTVRLVAEDVTAEDIVKALFMQLPKECVICVCPTVAKSWQITLINEEAKERLLMTALIVNNVRLEVTPPQDPPAFVSVKMPFEMADNDIISRIADNGQVAKITRRTYSFARHVETGVREYKVKNRRLDPLSFKGELCKGTRGYTGVSVELDFEREYV